MSSAINAASTASVPDDRPMACGYPERVAELALEPFDFRTADEALAVADARHGVEQGLAKRRVLCLEVEQRDGHKPSMVHAARRTRNQRRQARLISGRMARRSQARVSSNRPSNGKP